MDGSALRRDIPRARFSGSVALDEDLRILKAGLVYRSGVPFGLRGAASLWLNKGLPGLGAPHSHGLLLSVPGATAKFFRASVNAAVSVPLPRRFSYKSMLTGQWTDCSLPVAQKCGYGTNALSRGFDNSFVLGDRCIGMRHEIAFMPIVPITDAATMFWRSSMRGSISGWSAMSRTLSLSL